MKKYFILTIFFILIVVCGKFSNKHTVNIPISFSNPEVPIMKVGFEGKEYPFELSLNSKYPLFIDAHILDGISKSQKGQAEWKNEKGKREVSSLFQISNVQIGDLKLKRILAVSDTSDFKDQDSSGLFTWPFDKMNLILDFPHYQVFGVNANNDLKKLGYNINKMEKVKCIINKKGIYFKVVTDVGELNVILATSSNLNMINSFFWNKGDILKSKIHIGNKDFGNIEMMPYEIAQELEIDGILGVEFLKKHIVYIDAQNKMLYLGDRYSNIIEQRAFAKIPVEFTFSGLPVFEIEVEKNKYAMVFDLGSCWELRIPSKYNFPMDNLRNLNTQDISVNAFGEERKIDCFTLNECKIGNSLLKNIHVAKEDNQSATFGVTDEKIGNIDERQVGYLGHPILYRTNIYFDFVNSCFWFIANDRDLRKIDIQLEDFEIIPFEVQKGMIILKVKSDEGDIRLMLDTGASVSMINPGFYNGEKPSIDALGNPWFFSNSFVIGNSDYGKTRLYSFNISPKMVAVDGILGMEFLRQHPFYIDYPNRLIYFKKPKGQ